MALAQKVAALLESLTQNQVQSMSPADRQYLAGQCERVLRLAQVEGVVKDARDATAPKGGLLRDLRDGRGRE
jgi:hypothetical protein